MLKNTESNRYKLVYGMNRIVRIYKSQQAITIISEQYDLEFHNNAGYGMIKRVVSGYHYTTVGISNCALSETGSLKTKEEVKKYLKFTGLHLIKVLKVKP